MPKILLVDDEEGLLNILASVLRGQGYEVATTLSGVQAWDMLEEDGIDLLISDIRLADGVDGVELLKKAKLKENPPPVILITAFATVETAIQALRLGASDYLTKPFKMDDLLGAVAKAMGPKAVVAQGGTKPPAKKALPKIIPPKATRQKSPEPTRAEVPVRQTTKRKGGPLMHRVLKKM